jgi:hypothetical protein
MQIELQPYERSVLDVLTLRFSLERDLVVGLAVDLNRLANLFTEIVSCPDREFRAGRIVVMGLINHAHLLLVGGLQALQASNSAVWSGCARGLIEIFGACVLISERPSTTPNYLADKIAAGKLYAAAGRAHSGLARDLKRLHLNVHPASGAIFAGSKVVDKEMSVASFTFGLQPLDASDGREGVIVLANIADLIANKLNDLVSNAHALSTGNAILNRMNE